MVRAPARTLRAFVIVVVLAVTLVACGTSTSPSPSAGGSASESQPASSAAPPTGGTITILSQDPQFADVDPQRAYTGEDLAFFSATIYRSLTAYVYSPDDATASGLVPDMATDLGTSTPDAKTWTYTLRDGVTFEDGSPVECKDIKYAASRVFDLEIIGGGPAYAIAYLDVPYQEDGQTSQYPGPWKATPEQQALFDKSIDCSADGKTITFHLNQPVPDFPYTLTLGWSPVPAASDPGEGYGTPEHFPVSSGPYKVTKYTIENGGEFVLERNTNWSQASDTYRHPYPDKWVMSFGNVRSVEDQRLLDPVGDDLTTIQRDNVLPENLARVFKDPATPNPEFAGRAISGYDIYSLYIWINVDKVPNVKIRQAMMVALNRDGLRKNAGGVFLGDYADGAIKPNIGPDYAPTGLWTDLFGQAIPDTGDPDLAKKLIAESGEAAPSLTYDYRPSPVADRGAAIIKASLELAGFKVTPNPIASRYYPTIFSDAAHEFGAGGWGADWPNAKTVIAPLYTQKGGWDLSRANDPDFNAAVDAASRETDRAKQETMWQALNKQAVQNGWIIPTFFELQQRLTGGKVGGVYLWGPYGSWPYGDMYVIP